MRCGSTGRCGGARERAAGFSLIELVIVVALLLALSALAIPSLWGGRESVIWSRTLSSVETAAAMARGEAMRRGSPVSLAVRSRPGVQELWIWPFVAEDADAIGAGPGPAWSERLLALPSGIRLIESAELESGPRRQDAAGLSADGGGDGVGATPEPRPWLIFVPTGEARAARDLMIVGGARGDAAAGDAWARSASFSLSDWSGRVRAVERAAEPGADLPVADEPEARTSERSRPAGAAEAPE